MKSMTGYGRSQQILHGRDISVEIKSVNHRFFEFSSRIPRSYGFLEGKLKALLQSRIGRGKVDVGVTIYMVEGKEAEIGIHEELAKGYVDALRSVSESLSLPDDLTLSTLTRFSDVFSVRKAEEDEVEIWQDVEQVASEALDKFVKTREIEGARLKSDLQNRLAEIARLLGLIEEQAPKTVVAYRERLTAKMQEVLETSGIDEARILTEAALFADRIAIDEETVRLHSHLKEFAKLLEIEEPVGRKLDFMVQEMNRETNTIGSKANDLQVTGWVVAIKSEIEKIREQIQNLE